MLKVLLKRIVLDSRLLSGVAVLVFAGLSQHQAMAATVAVGTCQSALPYYATIQGAVNSVPPGSTIRVCPGTYPEQVVITKNNIKIFGINCSVTGSCPVSGSTTADQAVILPPAGGMVANTTSYASGNPIAAQVLIGGSPTVAYNGVNLTNITVDGSNNLIGGCAPNLMGIVYQNASGIVTGVATRHQRLSAGLEGCQNGLGIFVQSKAPQTSTVTVTKSSVRSYQKNGITGNEVGTHVTVTGNYVVGQGPTTGAAENGIQIAFGATGSVTGNSVIDHVYSPAVSTGDGASGILIYAAGAASSAAAGPTMFSTADGLENPEPLATAVPGTITTNTVGNSQFGIVLVTDLAYGPAADSWSITSNKISATRLFDAINVCSNSNTIKSNTIYSSDQSAIHLDSTCGGTGNSNFVQFNNINEACAGILDGTGTNNIGTNTFYNTVNTTVSGDSCPASSSLGRATQVKRRAVAIRP